MLVLSVVKPDGAALTKPVDPQDTATPLVKSIWTLPDAVDDAAIVALR
jgi:hypothetical protein